ncbi:ribulose 1,5-bisphosphate carboxylase [Alphaproteobacteria bacterium GH1-50]|uniref:Ribulose 1,5-bisphosphate carboxylase n=1 Tax=Kangsaoukella pontilimi TaxID=2691042 RepID=A0A7C9NG52_9RHOB|nr:RuBisCO large subunit C-terminal-like domain-containing protein [Kangsaoukella pontilimi]MXQ09219.1 ribulose 1,5-bisphosphate carboxylase [Kangsaoukella pontilimi]
MSRFTVTYRIFARSEAEARERALGVALEQTVEVPADVVPEGYIADEIVGRVEEIGAEGEGRYRAAISYSPDSTGTDLPQVLNVLFGNSSIQKGIKVTALDLGPLAGAFPGARFGIRGVRRLAGCGSGPMLAPVLKPMGSGSATLAEVAYRSAAAGAHVIKEDHGLADQPAAPFEARVEAVAAAVRRANDETGGNSLYFAALAGPAEKLMERARFAKAAGATGFLVMPGLYGFDLVRRLAEAPDLGLPIMTHPSFLGPYVLSEDTGFTHGMMFGVLQRLAGSDISVFPNVGGRFGFSAAECREIARACQSTDGIGAPMLPSPGGGMSPERAGEMREMYGDDTVFLLGGALLRHGDGIGDAVADLVGSFG